MLDDEQLLEQMALQEESPDDLRSKKVSKPQYAKSQYTVTQLQNLVGERVWVRCVSDSQPWADEKPMHQWKDYKVKIEEAILLDERRFAVILLTPDQVEEKPLKLKKQETK